MSATKNRIMVPFKIKTMCCICCSFASNRIKNIERHREKYKTSFEYLKFGLSLVYAINIMFWTWRSAQNNFEIIIIFSKYQNMLLFFLRFTKKIDNKFLFWDLRCWKNIFRFWYFEILFWVLRFWRFFFSYFPETLYFYIWHFSKYYYISKRCFIINTHSM